MSQVRSAVLFANPQQLYLYASLNRIMLMPANRWQHEIFAPRKKNKGRLWTRTKYVY